MNIRIFFQNTESKLYWQHLFLVQKRDCYIEILNGIFMVMWNQPYCKCITGHTFLLCFYDCSPKMLLTELKLYWTWDICLKPGNEKCHGLYKLFFLFKHVSFENSHFGVNICGNDSSEKQIICKAVGGAAFVGNWKHTSQLHTNMDDKQHLQWGSLQGRIVGKTKTQLEFWMWLTTMLTDSRK